MIKWLISDFELGIGVFQNHQLVILLPIGHFEKQQSKIENHQLVILLLIGDFHFSTEIHKLQQ